jgi:large subunit ribosomal protein L9
MKVVFLEDVPGTARIGEIKDVKPGFARNYLLPRRLAMAASPSIVKSAEQRAHREMRLEGARDAEAQKIAEKLDAMSFTIIAKAGQTGKLFGSVGTGVIAQKVGEVTGGEFDRHNVLMPDVVKDLGDYEVRVRLTRNVHSTVKFSVVGEDGTTAADIRANADAVAADDAAAASAADEASGDDDEA